VAHHNRAAVSDLQAILIRLMLAVATEGSENIPRFDLCFRKVDLKMR
jgi:hypothetical protein